MSADASVAGSPLSAEEVVAIRAQLPALASGRYMNTGTLGPMPRVAIEAMDRELRYDIEQRQSADLWERLTDACTTARRALAALTATRDEQLALMHSTHEGINAALWGIDWAAGDSIVTTDQEHPAAAVPMRHLRDRRGVEVKFVAWSGEETDDVLCARLAAACTARTRAVVISHVSWLSGAIAPLAAIRAALAADVRIVVDGAQGAGIVPVDPADGWDAYTISGQKWPCGPNGTGGLAVTDPESWLPTFGGATQVEFNAGGPFNAPLVADARRFETSQTAMVPLAGVSAAAAWVVGDIGVLRAHQHARALNAYARERIHAQLGAAPIAQVHGDAHLLAIELELPSAAKCVRALWDAQIQVSVPIAERRVRLSLGPWTTRDDVDAAIDVLEHALD